MVEFLNGNSVNWHLDAFSPGYFGLYLWDKYARTFRDLSSVYKDGDQFLWQLDVGADNPHLFDAGVLAAFRPDHNAIERNVALHGRRYTVSLVPFSRDDEAVLSPSMDNAYLVRGVPQADWDAVALAQVQIQSVNLALVALAMGAQIVLSYLPLHRFLVALEKALKVSSLSADRAARREQAALSMMMIMGAETGAHDTAAPALLSATSRGSASSAVSGAPPPIGK